MNQFPTLVEYLLLSNDYVVIPGLGTFIVQQMDARWDEEEEVFLPPYRSVRFNSEIKQGDHTLLSSIARIYHYTKEQSEKLLGTWLMDFKQNMEDEGCIEFGSIGIFTQDNKTIHFTSKESGVTTPEYYGLDAFHFDEIEPKATAKVVPLTAAMEADDDEITIRINRRIANFFAVACVAILLFVVFHLPHQDMSNTGVMSNIQELLIPQTGTKAETPVIDTKAKEPKTTIVEAETPSTPTTAEPMVETAEEYCIVMASAITRSNAEKYVETLTKRGFLSARVVDNGNIVRVVVGHYQDQEAATEAAREIHRRSSEYQNAWVHRI